MCSMCRLIKWSAAALVVFLLVPATARGQAAITGVVRDASGAVIPGVSVEAASPVLIEKVRSATTDGTGQYRILDLRPGTYSVTFELSGFTTVKRQGIELSGTFVATVNAELRVGGVAETITVTGESPVVDVQSATQQTVVNKDIIEQIPTGRQITSVGGLLPGNSDRPDVGGSTLNVSSGGGTIHGGNTNDTRSLVDGMSIGWSGSASNQIMPPIGGSQEVTIGPAGGLGEAESGGIILNIVPRDGSNRLSGSFFGTGSNGSMQSNNYTAALKAEGLSSPNNVIKNYDLNPMFGGPIKKDKVWFYLTARAFDQENTVAGLFANSAPRLSYLYVPNMSIPAETDSLTTSATIRLTIQVTPRNKVNVAWDEQGRCVDCKANASDPGGYPTGSNAAPEGSAKNYAAPTRLQQVTYQSPITSKLLLEGGFGTYLQRYGLRPPTNGTYDPSVVAAENIGSAFPNTVFRAPTLYWSDWVGTYTWRASLSYVTGSNNLKVGYSDGRYDGTRNRYPNDPTNPIDLYTFNGFDASGNPKPSSITVTAAPISSEFIIHPLALYAQDSWSRKRLTLQGGLRFDWTTTNFAADPLYALNGNYPQIGPSPLVPVPIQFTNPALLTGVNFKDISPRMATTVDVFGNGRTAFKLNVGRYVRTQTGDGDPLDLNPVNRVLNTGGPGGSTPFSTTRSWSGPLITDGNGNVQLNCNLANPAANGNCGAYSNQTFGQLIQGQQVFTNNFDPKVTQGWGVRPYEWDLLASVQQQILNGVSAEVGYYRRWAGNFLVAQNLDVTAADFNTFNVTVADPRLPGGVETVNSLYNVSPAKFGLTNNIVTAASNFGYQFQHWNGVDTKVTGHWRGATFQAGTSTGRQSTG